MQKNKVTLEKNFDEQSKIRNEIKSKIDISRAILVGLKRKAALATVADSNDAAGAQTKKSKDQGNFDPSKLLRTLRSKIKQIHVDRIGQGEVDSKATLSLLEEIENVIIRYSRKIQSKRLQNEEVVKKQEAELKREYMKEINIQTAKQMIEKEEA